MKKSAIKRTTPPLPFFYYFIFCVLGFLSGLPLMLVGSTLQAWGTTAGLNLGMLGALTLVGLPYAYKFLWAPFLDRYSIPFCHGHRRGWILLLLLIITSSLFFLSLSQLPKGLTWFIGWSLFTAFCSATLDISIDAYRTELLPKEDYALGNACYVSTYRISMLVSGGLSLIVADHLSWETTYQLNALIMLAGFFICFFLPEPKALTIVAKKTALRWQQILWAPLKKLWERKSIFWLLLFILLYKFGEALGSALTSTFLLRELHFSLTVLGGVYKTIGVVATISGAFVGGFFYKKIGLYRSLLSFGILQALGILLFVALAAVHQLHLPLMITAVGAEAFTAGMATTVFLALLMRLCVQPYTATHFALLSACASIGRIFTGPLASFCVAHTNWEIYFMISFLACIPALILLLTRRSIFSNL